MYRLQGILFNEFDLTDYLTFKSVSKSFRGLALIFPSRSKYSTRFSRVAIVTCTKVCCENIARKY